MNFGIFIIMAASSNGDNTGHKSAGSLTNPHNGVNKRAYNSEPFLRPKFKKLKDRLLKKIQKKLKDLHKDQQPTDYSQEENKTAPSLNGYNTWVLSNSAESLSNPHNGEFKSAPMSFLKAEFKKNPNLQNDQQPKDFSMEESKFILRELAAELDRLVPLKELVILHEVKDDKIHHEVSQALILQWADELRSQQQKREQQTLPVIQELNNQMPTEPMTTAHQEASQNLDKDQRLKDSNKILSIWAKKLKRKESVSFKEEHKTVLKDLCKQWKKGQLVNMLPIMDFIIRTLLQDNKSEESFLKQWFKSETIFHKAGGSYIPIPVWNCITRPSAEVILDPNTANPSLVLSENRRTLRTKTHDESKNDPWAEHHRKPSKYDGWTCVQAEKGYKTGRYYWEVDVKGKCDWRIGVVKESAPRQGFVNMNTTAGYWTLRLQLGSLMALTEPVTKLNQSIPSKLGVYLDIEEGRVAFYNSETRIHIYTFKTDFKKLEKLYPVFGTVETNRPLRII